MRKKIAATMEHVQKHRAKYSAGVTAIAFLSLMNRNANVLNEFLKEHNLYDVYYTFDEE